MSTAVDGFGTTVVFATSGFTANLLSVDGPGVERAAINSSHMATASSYMTYIPAKLSDGGSVDIEFEFNGADAPPITAAAETITIDWAGDTGDGEYSFTGFMTNYSPSASVGERMTATATLKVSGVVSYTADA